MNKIMLVLVLFLSLHAFGEDKKVEKPSFYSLYAWASEFPQFADEVEKVGFKWMRVNGPAFDSDEDKGIVEIVKRGIHFVPVIGAKDHDITNMPVFREYVRKYFSRYGEGGSLWKENPSAKPFPLEYIEVWNEPNIGYLTPSGGKKRDECYAEFLKVAYEEIKKVNPNIKVIGMNTSGGALSYDGFIPPNQEYQGKFGWFSFIKGVDQHGGGKFCDIVGIHPYARNRTPEKAAYIQALEELRAECKTNGGGEKPIWVTEVGYSLPMKELKDTAIEGAVKNEEDQANYIIRLMAISAANDVGQFQIMYISDIHDFKAGLFDRSKKWRKQTYAIKNMMEILPEPVLIKKLSEGSNDVFAYLFKGTGNKETILAWATGKNEVEKEFEVKGSELTLATRDGEKKTIKASDGKVKVSLSQSPIYIY